MQTEILHQNQKIQYLKHVLEDAKKAFGEPALKIPDFNAATSYAQALEAVKTMRSPPYLSMEPKAGGDLNKRMLDYIIAKPVGRLQLEFRADIAKTDFAGKVKGAESAIDAWLNSGDWSFLRMLERNQIKDEFALDVIHSRNVIKDPNYRSETNVGEVEQFYEKWRGRNINTVIISLFPKMIISAVNALSPSVTELMNKGQITDPAIREEVLKSIQAQQALLRKRIGNQEINHQRALLKDIQAVDPEKHVLDISRKQLMQRQQTFRQEIEKQEHLIAQQYKLSEDEIKSLHDALQTRIYLPLQKFEQELTLLKSAAVA